MTMIDSIHSTQIEIDGEYEGIVYKYSKTLHIWQKRYIRTRGNALLIYKKTTSTSFTSRGINKIVTEKNSNSSPVKSIQDNDSNDENRSQEIGSSGKQKQNDNEQSSVLEIQIPDRIIDFETILYLDTNDGETQIEEAHSKSFEMLKAEALLNSPEQNRRGSHGKKKDKSKERRFSLPASWTTSFNILGGGQSMNNSKDNLRSLNLSSMLNLNNQGYQYYFDLYDTTGQKMFTLRTLDAYSFLQWTRLLSRKINKAHQAKIQFNDFFDLEMQTNTFKMLQLLATASTETEGEEIEGKEISAMCNDKMNEIFDEKIYDGSIEATCKASFEVLTLLKQLYQDFDIELSYQRQILQPSSNQSGDTLNTKNIKENESNNSVSFSRSYHYLNKLFRLYFTSIHSRFLLEISANIGEHLTVDTLFMVSLESLLYLLYFIIQWKEFHRIYNQLLLGVTEEIFSISEGLCQEETVFLAIEKKLLREPLLIWKKAWNHYSLKNHNFNKRDYETFARRRSSSSARFLLNTLSSLGSSFGSSFGKKSNTINNNNNDDVTSKSRNSSIDTLEGGKVGKEQSKGSSDEDFFTKVIDERRGSKEGKKNINHKGNKSMNFSDEESSGSYNSDDEQENEITTTTTSSDQITKKQEDQCSFLEGLSTLVTQETHLFTLMKNLQRKYKDDLLVIPPRNFSTIFTTQSTKTISSVHQAQKDTLKNMPRQEEAKLANHLHTRENIDLADTKAEEICFTLCLRIRLQSMKKMLQMMSLPKLLKYYNIGANSFGTDDSLRCNNQKRNGSLLSSSFLFPYSQIPILNESSGIETSCTGTKQLIACRQILISQYNKLILLETDSNSANFDLHEVLHQYHDMIEKITSMIIIAMEIFVKSKIAHDKELNEEWQKHRQDHKNRNKRSNNNDTNDILDTNNSTSKLLLKYNEILNSIFIEFEEGVSAEVSKLDDFNFIYFPNLKKTNDNYGRVTESCHASDNTKNILPSFDYFPEPSMDTRIFLRQLIIEKIVFIFMSNFFSTFLFDVIRWDSLVGEEILSFLKDESLIKEWIFSLSIIDDDSAELTEKIDINTYLPEAKAFFQQYLISSYLWLFKVFRTFFYIPANECLDYFIETLSEVGSDPLSMLSFPQNEVITDGSNMILSHQKGSLCLYDIIRCCLKARSSTDIKEEERKKLLTQLSLCIEIITNEVIKKYPNNFGRKTETDEGSTPHSTNYFLLPSFVNEKPNYYLPQRLIYGILCKCNFVFPQSVEIKVTNTDEENLVVSLVRENRSKLFHFLLPDIGKTHITGSKFKLEVLSRMNILEKSISHMINLRLDQKEFFKKMETISVASKVARMKKVSCRSRLQSIETAKSPSSYKRGNLRDNFLASRQSLDGLTLTEREGSPLVNRTKNKENFQRHEREVNITGRGPSTDNIREKALNPFDDDDDV